MPRGLLSLIEGKECASVALHAMLRTQFRLVGYTGVVGIALAGIELRGGLLALTVSPLVGHAASMKIAVSIPDDVFAEAEALSKRLMSSRSENYSRALGEFIGRHAPDRVTALMNEVVREMGSEPNEFSRVAAHRILRKSEW